MSQMKGKNRFFRKKNESENPLKMTGRERFEKKKDRKAPQIPIPPELLEKHTRGSGISGFDKISSETERKKLLRKEKVIEWAEKQTARNEILLTEDPGFIQYEEGESVRTVTQRQIAKNVDVTSATKFFELDLNFGPYRIDYTRNGRHLLIGGRKGHVAAFDWVTKNLHCELNVTEEVFDVQWLHIETMYAIAQKNWVYIYDNQGVELHCLKNLYRVLRMQFLPYHFLLASCNEDGYLTWLDISIGKLISTLNTHKGRLSVMTQNPYNGVICLGHNNGTVSMWSPNQKKPLAQMLCHNIGVEAISIDHTGKYMITSSANREMKVWDVRKLEGPLKNYKLRGSPTDMSLSQNGCLALATKNVVEVFKNCHINDVSEPILIHRGDSVIDNVEFCPFEDVLGVGTKHGFTSMIVPGAGEANFDAYELNPMQAKSQRREAEVKSLLEKIQPELITLDPMAIGQVNIPTLKDRIEAKNKILDLKPEKFDFEPRKKRRGNTARATRVKKIVKENYKKDFIKNMKEIREKVIDEHGERPDEKPKRPKGVLDRFRKKKI